MSEQIHPRVADINARVKAGGKLTDIDSRFLDLIGDGVSPHDADLQVRSMIVFGSPGGYSLKFMDGPNYLVIGVQHWFLTSRIKRGPARGKPYRMLKRSRYTTREI